MSDKRSVIKRVVLLILVLYYALIIFSFSSKPASTSNKQSGKVVEIVYDSVVDKIDIQSTVSEKDSRKMLEHFIRKTAHFFNFFILGLFVFSYLSCFDKSKKYCLIFALLICLFAASSDEIIQCFTLGRDGRFKDVLIDVTGSALGILIYNLPGVFHNAVGLIRKRRVKVYEKA